MITTTETGLQAAIAAAQERREVAEAARRAAEQEAERQRVAAALVVFERDFRESFGQEMLALLPQPHITQPSGSVYTGGRLSFEYAGRQFYIQHATTGPNSGWWVVARTRRYESGLVSVRVPIDGKLSERADALLLTIASAQEAAKDDEYLPN